MSDEATLPGPGEQLSALLDGELPPEQTDFLLKRVQRDRELRSTLQRYQLVGDTLRGERVRARPDFALRVSAAIAQEPALPAPASRTGGARRRAGWATWLKPVAGLAVAASVASVAVVVLQRDPRVTGGAPATVAATTIGGIAGPVVAPLSATLTPGPVQSPLLATSLTGEPASYVTPPAGRAPMLIPPSQLASYVVAHSEYSSPLGRRNVLTGLMAGEPLAAPSAAPAQGTAEAAPAAGSTAAPRR